MVQRINNFSTIRSGITHKSTHIHFYYSRPDIAETTITTTIQLSYSYHPLVKYYTITWSKLSCVPFVDLGRSKHRYYTLVQYFPILRGPVPEMQQLDYYV